MLIHRYTNYVKLIWWNNNNKSNIRFNVFYH